MNKDKLIYSSSIGAILSAIFVVIVTIWGENSPALKGWLTDLTGHHWVSKSIISLIIYFGGFVLFYYLPKRMGKGTVKKYLNWLLAVTFFGAVTIFIFFVGHYLRWF